MHWLAARITCRPCFPSPARKRVTVDADNKKLQALQATYQHVYGVSLFIVMVELLMIFSFCSRSPTPLCNRR
jgi:hypothetical protein